MRRALVTFDDLTDRPHSVHVTRSSYQGEQ